MKNLSRSIQLIVLLVFIAWGLFSGACTWAVKTDRDLPVEVLLMSDLHFNPFVDPSKVEALIEAPVARWKEILVSPSEGSLSDFDTSYALWSRSLKEMRKASSHPSVILISGDFMSHH